MSEKINYQLVSLNGNRSANAIISELSQISALAGFSVVDIDNARPWGGFIRFDAIDSEKFASQFFKNIEIGIKDSSENLLPISPKFLLVAPHQRLSWQRHERRSEIWKFLTANGAYSQSTDPNIQPIIQAKAGDIVEIQQGYCHRLISQSDDFVLVAEIWRHTNLEHPSDEADNERLQDDYNR